MDNKWDIRFIELARFIATWSKDPSTKTGAVIARPDKTICSVGYNGFPRGMDDDYAKYANRSDKYSRIVHCEMNAILNSKESIKGYWLYLWPFISCDRCAVHVIQSGISKVVSPYPSQDILDRWEDSIVRTRNYFKECGIEVSEVKIN